MRHVHTLSAEELIRLALDRHIIEAYREEDGSIYFSLNGRAFSFEKAKARPFLLGLIQGHELQAHAEAGGRIVALLTLLYMVGWWPVYRK